MFEGSKTRKHQIADDFRAALFRLLEERPRDFIYSIAFHLSYLPLRGWRGSKSTDADDGKDRRRFNTAAYTAMSELFDLLDDHIRETDALTFAELTRSRCFDEPRYNEANETYVAEYGAMMKKFEPYVSKMHQSSSEEKQGIIVATKEDGSAESGATTTLSVDAACSADMRTVMRYIDENTVLPLVANMNNSITTNSLWDLATSENIRNSSGTITPMTISTATRSDGSLRLSKPAVMPQQTAMERFKQPFCAMEAFLLYAPIYHRYRSLAPLMERIASERNVRLFPVYMPRGIVWQCGESQLLWILLHTIAALSVQRSNLYSARVFTILRNLDFFIGCTECAHHWRQNRCEHYFSYLANVCLEGGELIVRALPMDVILVQCHNYINGPQRALSLWQLSQIIFDYREFADVGLLRRYSDGESNPYRDLRPSEEAYLSTPDAGETLITRLWRSIDRFNRLPLGVRCF